MSKKRDDIIIKKPDPISSCICPSCGERVSSQRGVRCNVMKCPRCGSNMIKEL